MNLHELFQSDRERLDKITELENVFAFRGGIGGLGGNSQVNFYAQNDWLLRARFLLSGVKDDHLSTMLNIQDGFQEHFFTGTASWMCGLLKKREHIPKIKELMLKERIFFRQPVYLISLLLYEDNSLADCFEQYIQKFTFDKDNVILAKACLELLSSENKKVEWENLPQKIESKEKYKFWKELIRRSILLRAGIIENDSSAFQYRLRWLIDHTATAEQHLVGLLSENNLDSFKIPSPDKNLSIAANDFFANPSIANTENLKMAVEQTNDISGLLRLEEHDIYYQIPGDILISLYEKVMDPLPRTIPLLERCAYGLLLRGTEHDELAKNLLQEAKTIKSEFGIFEDERIICPMYK